jgi:hypothetical protein
VTAFPQVPLGQQCEILTGNVWTDVTAWTLHDSGGEAAARPAVTITRGRADETTSGATPAQAAWKADNTGGRFTARNPLGAWYPYLRRGALARWSVPAAVNYLRLETDSSSYVSCPNSTSLNITGDLEARIDLQLTSGTSCILMSKGAAAGPYSWAWGVNADGTQFFQYSPDGTTNLRTATSAVPMPWTSGRFSMRVTYAWATGIVTFWYGSSVTGPWTQLGAPVYSGATTGIASTTQPVVVGYDAFHAGLTGMAQTFGGTPGQAWKPAADMSIQGRVYEFQLYSGIGGTLVADPVFSSQTPGASSFADGQGNTWTLAGTAEISARDFRFHGELSSLPTEWDPTGHDVWSQVTASGPLRRLSQGSQPPVGSAMTRGWQHVTGVYAPIQCWPCEDAAGATQLASGLPGQPAIVVYGSPQLASDSSFPGSAPIPAVNNSRWVVNVPAYTQPASPANVLRFLLDVPSGGDTNNGLIVRMYTSGSVQHVDLTYGTGGNLRLVGYSESNTAVFDSAWVTFALDGAPCYVEVALSTNGTAVTWHVNTLKVGAGGQLGLSGNYASASVGAVTRIVFGGNLNIKSSVGQISLQTAYNGLGLQDGPVAGPFQGWVGETAGLRFARLVREQGLQPRIHGWPSASVPMGAQTADTFTTLLQACEDADRGLTFEPRSAPSSLGYRPLSSMVNQAPVVTLNYPAGQVTPPMLAADDDQHLRNDVTVANTGRSSARVTLNDGSPTSVTGAGDYGASYTVNLAGDGQLGDVAGWITHVGTADEARYPGITVDLAATSMQPLAAAARAVDDGDYVKVTSPPAWLPPGPVRQLAYGFTETLGDFRQMITWNCVPESPFEVLTAGSGSAAADFHLDTDGSALHTGIGAADTSMQVDTAAGAPVWTTSASDFPFDVLMGGEQITVTGITGAASPQTFTVTRSVNGIVKTHTAGEAVTLARRPILALT